MDVRLPSADGILSLDLASVDLAPSVVVDSEPFMAVTAGEGGCVQSVVTFKSDDGRFTVDVSKYDQLTLALTDWPVDEFMFILDGEVEIRDAVGVGRVYGPGSGFVMTRGFTGTWVQHGPIKKIAVSYTS